MTYHSFELAPDTPVDFDGSEIDFLVEHKGMRAAQVEPMLDRVAGIAKEVGLEYDFDALQHTNTIKAHQLLHFAKQHGKQLELTERLLKAYFVEGRHVGRDEDLADLAQEIGLDREDALRALDATTSTSTTSTPTSTRRARMASTACRSSSSTASTASPARSAARRSRRCSTRSPRRRSAA